MQLTITNRLMLTLSVAFLSLIFVATYGLYQLHHAAYQRAFEIMLALVGATLLISGALAGYLYLLIKHGLDLSVPAPVERLDEIGHAVTVSTQIVAGNPDLPSPAEEQAGSREEAAPSMEQLISTAKQNATYARQANQLAWSASDIAMQGKIAISQVVDTMSSISDASKKIANIIGTIDDIAFQTDMLALTAAVEAKRAGEHGRGFATVASEVRTLAQRSAAAAWEIKNLIFDSLGKVDSGVRQVYDTGAAMNDVIESIKRVSDIVGEITVAGQGRSAGIGQAGQIGNPTD
jgi:methyl-accepting chemotaxis protein